MIVLSDKPKLIISKTNIIYKPKPKKIYKSKPNYSLNFYPNKSYQINPKRKNKKNLDLNLKNNAKSEKFDVESISLEEMEKDFKRLKAKREISKVEEELKQIMEESTKDKSREKNSNKKKKNKGIKRPKNVKYVLYKNFDFEYDMIV